KDLDSTDRSIQQFKTDHNIVDYSAQGHQYIQSVGSSDQRIAEINSQLSVLDELSNYITSKGGSGVPSTIGLNDPALPGMIARLSEAETSYEKLRMTTGENNPMTLQLKEEIDRLRPTINETIESQ